MKVNMNALLAQMRFLFDNLDEESTRTFIEDLNSFLPSRPLTAHDLDLDGDRVHKLRLQVDEVGHVVAQWRVSYEALQLGRLEPREQPQPGETMSAAELRARVLAS